jgi:hypothetical protein
MVASNRPIVVSMPLGDLFSLIIKKNKNKKKTIFHYYYLLLLFLK